MRGARLWVPAACGAGDAQAQLRLCRRQHAWPGKSLGLCLPAEAAAQFHLHCLHAATEKLVQTPVHANLGIFFLLSCRVAPCQHNLNAKCCLEVELGHHLLNTPTSSILPLRVGTPSGLPHLITSRWVCVWPQPARLLICPNATNLG